MERVEHSEVEGEIGLVIDYRPGVAKALDVLGGAMAMIQALERLDVALLSSINSKLEPVSILNDVQHSSMKLLLARVVRSISDVHLETLDAKAWIGTLLVKGKHLLLKNLEADAPQIQATLLELKPEYEKAPLLLGYEPPKASEIKAALVEVQSARESLGDDRVIFQSELGDIDLGRRVIEIDRPQELETMTRTNVVRELLKVRYPDMLGRAQWTVNRGGKMVRVVILHERFLNDFHHRKIAIMPGDSLDCQFEDTVRYDANGNELDRKIDVIEVFGVVSPPKQAALPLGK